MLFIFWVIRLIVAIRLIGYCLFRDDMYSSFGLGCASLLNVINVEKSV